MHPGKVKNILVIFEEFLVLLVSNSEYTVVRNIKANIFNKK
jgi:hypothetical protein